MKTRFALAAIAAVTVQACAQQGASAAADVPAKSSWIVSKASCPAGCSAATVAVLKAQVGQHVTLSATRVDMPFVDPCEGSVHLRLNETPVTDVVAEVDKGPPPGHRRLQVADLGVTGAVLSGWALCRGAQGDTNLLRLLMVAPDRVVLLGEEQSLIELRCATAARQRGAATMDAGPAAGRASFLQETACEPSPSWPRRCARWRCFARRRPPPRRRPRPTAPPATATAFPRCR